MRKINNRDACSIEMGDHVVVTGGRYGSVPFESVRAEVSVYTSQGWVEDYAGLITGRQQHGCGHYINGDNNVVSHIASRQRALKPFFVITYKYNTPD